jgi:hypothetical protein
MDTEAMTDSPLIAPEEAAQPTARRAPWLPIAIAVLVLAAIAGGFAGQQLNARQAIPDWDRRTELIFRAPAGDAFAADTPWAQVRLAPVRADAENSIQAAAGFLDGTPVPAAGPPHVTAVTVQSVSGEAAGLEPAVIAAGENGELSGTVRLDQAGWHHIVAEIAGARQSAEFYLLVPDPSINGPNAVPQLSSSAEAEAVFQRGLAATTALKSVHYSEWVGDGAGNSAVSLHTVVARAGEPPALSFRITGGTEVVIIGSTRWVKPPGDVVGWQRQEGVAITPPSAWGDELSGATGFTLLGEETIDGEATQIVAFVAPELSEPRRRTVAWYLWWVGTETGQVRREAMVSRQHYMFRQYSDFNEPLQILPPDEGTPVAGTPAPEATPSP